MAAFLSDSQRTELEFLVDRLQNAPVGPLDETTAHRLSVFAKEFGYSQVHVLDELRDRPLWVFLRAILYLNSLA